MRGSFGAIKRVLFSRCAWQTSHSRRLISSQLLPRRAIDFQTTGRCTHEELLQSVRSSAVEGIQEPACSVGKPKKKLYISSVSSPRRHSHKKAWYHASSIRHCSVSSANMLMLFADVDQNISISVCYWRYPVVQVNKT